MIQRIDIAKKMADYNLMSVVRADPERTLEIAKACYDGGVKMIEISFTVPTAIESIELVKKELPDVIICAGTVLDPTTARLAVLHGADAILSPQFDADVAKITNLYQIPYCPGCHTVTEMTTALKAGASYIKFFPGSAVDGPKLIKTAVTPTPFMPILASGGINFDNFYDFLDAGADITCFGGLLANGDAKTITEHASKLNEMLKTYRETH
ncbi:beta/alpha barrel domain-containing protein [Limosilactobacillus caecicola]|uniref:ketohydroxyglutarate aldolase n=1 Tax=Limosilactobacillus caecicola TaxID=2941332 RepID=UPI0020407CEA|nr:ketohydroxyglutarate aldolase [Limosilactobacillus caecicola]